MSTCRALKRIWGQVERLEKSKVLHKKNSHAKILIKSHVCPNSWTYTQKHCLCNFRETQTEQLSLPGESNTVKRNKNSRPTWRRTFGDRWAIASVQRFHTMFPLQEQPPHVLCILLSYCGWNRGIYIMRNLKDKEKNMSENHLRTYFIWILSLWIPNMQYQGNIKVPTAQIST